MPPLAIALIGAIIQQIPAASKMVSEAFARKEISQSDWDALWDHVRALDYDKAIAAAEARAAAQG